MTGSSTTLEELRAAVAAFRDERDWARFHTPKNLAMAVVTEAAELAELYLWEEGSDAPSPQRVRRTAEEMADVLIYLLCIADALDIDIAAAVDEKLQENARRYPAELVQGDVEKYNESKLRSADRV